MSCARATRFRPSITRRGLLALALGLLAVRPGGGADLRWRDGWLLRADDG